MASTLSRKRDELIEDLEDQVSSLKRELASVRRSATRHGSSIYDDLSDAAASFLDQFMRQGGSAGKQIARQALHARETASDYPVVTTLAGIAVIGLLASLLLRR